MEYEVSDFIKGYVIALLWSEVSDPDPGDPTGGYFLVTDENVPDDFSQEAWLKIMRDCTDFELTHGAEIGASECSRGSGDHSVMEQAGHDFALTRNGHGAGFWDGDWPKEIGERLTLASKSYGSQHLYVGDDKLIYVN